MSTKHTVEYYLRKTDESIFGLEKRLENGQHVINKYYDEHGQHNEDYVMYWYVLQGQLKYYLDLLCRLTQVIENEKKLISFPKRKDISQKIQDANKRLELFGSLQEGK